MQSLRDGKGIAETSLRTSQRGERMVNKAGREIPDHVAGYGPVAPFAGAFSTLPGNICRYAPPVKAVRPGESKLADSLEDDEDYALKASDERSHGELDLQSEAEE
jgi:hypothetical protein